MSEPARGDIDASVLPSFAFGHRSLMWWGTAGVMAIEGTVFAIAIVMYLYLRTLVKEWPPAVPPPSLTWGTVNTVILVASVLPNWYTKRAAERLDLHGVRIGMAICLVFAVAFMVVRGFEFTTLNCKWDTNAYASAVWFLLGLHTTHLVTDFYDSAVLAALMYTDPIEGKRFVDVSENALYWNFVVAAWIPIYAIIYLAPRWL